MWLLQEYDQHSFEDIKKEEVITFGTLTGEEEAWTICFLFVNHLKYEEK